MSADITSRPYQPNPDVCCEACVFGRGEHARWCLLKGRYRVRARVEPAPDYLDPEIHRLADDGCPHA